MSVFHAEGALLPEVFIASGCGFRVLATGVLGEHA